MTDSNTPVPDAAVLPELPVVGYRYGTAFLWPDDAPMGEPDCEPLTPRDPAQAQINSLRDEVERLKRERDEAMREGNAMFEANMRLVAELAALKGKDHPHDI